MALASQWGRYGDGLLPESPDRTQKGGGGTLLGHGSRHLTGWLQLRAAQVVLLQWI